MCVPAVGTEGFRNLSFKDQLEILSLQLFQPDQYNDLIGKPKANLILEYPPLPDIQADQVPVSFMDNYWAGYSCKYNDRWYKDQLCGFTPLDEFGVQCRRMVNIFLFDFPFMSMSTAVYYAFSHVRKVNQLDAPTSLLIALKIIAYMELELHQDNLHEVTGGDISKVRSKAMYKYRSQLTLDEFNGYYPMIYESEYLHAMEYEELVPTAFPKPRHRRWYYPLVPSKLYSGPFHIYTWDFLK